MKKILFFVFFASLISLLNANEIRNESGSASVLLKTDKVSYGFVESGKTAIEKFAADSSDSKPSPTVLKAIGFAGLGIFLASDVLYFISALAGAGVSLGTYGTGTWLAPMAGIIVSSFIPLIGPWLGTGLLGYMASTPLMVPLAYRTHPIDFFGGLIALCVILGIFEWTGFIMMIAGFASAKYYAMIKESNVLFFAGNDVKGNTTAGIRIRI